MQRPHEHRRAVRAGRGRWALPVVAAMAWLAGCATPPPAGLQEGRQLIALGRFEEGLAKLEQAANTQPRHPTAYTSYITQRDAIVGAQVKEGDALRQRGDFDGAEAQYRQALRLDRTSVLASAGMEALGRARTEQAQVAQAQAALQKGDLAGAERIVRAVLADNSGNAAARALMKTIAAGRAEADAVPPRLRAALKRTVTLDLRDAPLRSILGILASHGELNFVFDRDVRSDARASIMVRETSLDDVLKVLLLTNQLDRKVLNENTVLIYPATQAKQREYQELVTRSFYLANADPKQTAAMIRALVKTRDLFVDEKLNLIVMRDTPDAVRFAEQLVATQDLGEPEVMLELEVLEVASSLVQEIGLRYPGQVSFISGGDPASGQFPSLVEVGKGTVRPFVSNPVLLLNLQKAEGATNLLANPRIRVKNREKAKVHIGERVPVITTTAAANVGISTSVNYLETGLKLDVEPNIYLEDEVGIKVQLEVSNILEQLNVSGTVAYRLGTRNAATSLRLRDGETQVLAGLISSEDRRSINKVPFAGDMPMLGRLFRNDDERGSKTEIVLLLTPRIVRNLQRPDTVLPQMPAGTEAAPGAAPLRLAGGGGRIGITPDAPAAGATAQAPAAPARPATAAPATINVSAPAQVQLGQEFVMAFSVPTGGEPLSARLQLSYDPTVLAVVTQPGAPASAGGGSVTLALEAPGLAGTTPAPAQVRFRAIATAPVQTEVGMEIVDSSRPVHPLSSPHALGIVGGAR